MQVQSVNNTKSNMNFSSRDEIKNASAFVNMEDTELKRLAFNTSVDKDSFKKKNHHMMIATVCALPIVDTLASGILVEKSPLVRSIVRNTLSLKKPDIQGLLGLLKKAPLSLRTYSAASTAANWALGLTAMGAYNVAKKNVTSNSPKTKSFEHKNPVLSFLVDIAAITALFVLGRKGVNRLIARRLQKHPEALQRLNENLAKATIRLDNSNFNKNFVTKTNESAEKFAKAAPKMAKVGRFAITNAVFIIFTAGIFKLITHANHQREKADKTYHQLKATQFEAAKYLTNVLSVERDILAQDQRKLAKELRRETRDTEPFDELD